MTVKFLKHTIECAEGLGTILTSYPVVGLSKCILDKDTRWKPLSIMLIASNDVSVKPPMTTGILTFHLCEYLINYDMLNIVH